MGGLVGSREKESRKEGEEEGGRWEERGEEDKEKGEDALRRLNRLM